MCVRVCVCCVCVCVCVCVLCVCVCVCECVCALIQVLDNGQHNRMTSISMATSFGPSLFPYLPASTANTLLRYLLEHCSQLFEDTN